MPLKPAAEKEWIQAYRICEKPLLVAIRLLDVRKDTSTTRKPNEEEDRLQNQSPLCLRQIEMLWVMAHKVAEHVDHQDHCAKKIEHCSYDAVPEPLRISPHRTDRWVVDVHTKDDGRKLQIRREDL